MGNKRQWYIVIFQDGGVPQRSMMGPVLSNTFLNYLENEVYSRITKFTDDTKLFHVTESQTDSEKFQKDLTKLSE